MAFHFNVVAKAEDGTNEFESVEIPNTHTVLYVCVCVCVCVLPTNSFCNTLALVAWVLNDAINLQCDLF